VLSILLASTFERWLANTTIYSFPQTVHSECTHYSWYCYGHQCSQNLEIPQHLGCIWSCRLLEYLQCRIPMLCC